jgi:hypothetical protein
MQMELPDWETCNKMRKVQVPLNTFIEMKSAPCLKCFAKYSLFAWTELWLIGLVFLGEKHCWMAG